MDEIFVQVHESSENSRPSLSYISRRSLEQISEIVNSSKPKRDQINIQCNFMTILQLLQGVIEHKIPTHLESVLSNRALQQLLQKFSYCSISYYILITINKYTNNQFNPQEQHQYFITQQPTQSTLLLEAFVHILQEHRIEDQSLARTLLAKVSKQIEQSLQQTETQPKIARISHNIINRKSNYLYQFSIGNSFPENYQPEKVICSIIKDPYRDNLKENYKLLLNQIEQRITQAIKRKIMQEVLMGMGMIIYLQTMKLCKERKAPQKNIDTFPMEMAGFREIANINNYQIKLSYVKKSQQQEDILQLSVTILSSELNLISKQLFYQNPPCVQMKKDNKTITKSLYVQDLIYVLDSSKKIGKGSFGQVFQSTSLHLHHCRKEGETAHYFFKRKEVAIKELSLEEEHIHQRYIPLNRQHLIISLMKELSHREMIKKTKRQLGVQVDGDAPGINRIVPMVQFFKRPAAKPANATYLIVFEVASYSLTHKQFIGRFMKEEHFEERLLDLFSKILQGLNFLHSQVNKYYHNQLRRYFTIQKEQRQNKEKDTLIQFPQKGRNGILHRDIKPSNIVVNLNSADEVTDLFIIDFGMAKITDFSRNDQQTNCGSTYYIAPQIRNEKNYDEKADMWSLGVFMLQMYTKNKQKLFSSIHSHAMNQTVHKISSHVKRITKGNQPWSKLLAMMLNKEPKERAEAKAILQYIHEQQIILKGNMKAVEQAFKDGRQYIFAEDQQTRTKTIKEIQGDQRLDWDVENGQTNECTFRRIRLHEFLMNNINSPSMQQMYALVSLYHLSNSKQIITDLCKIDILTTRLQENKHLIIIKERQCLEKHPLQIQQTFMLAKLLDRPILALTNNIMKQIATSNRGYCNAFLMQQPFKETLVRIQHDYKGELKAHLQDTSCLLTSTTFNSFKSTIMLSKDSNTTPLKVAQSLLQLLNQDLNKGKKIVLELSSESFPPNENVKSLLNLYQREDSVTLSFNSKQASALIEFSQQMQSIVRKLLKMDIEITYKHRMLLSLFLSVKEQQEFNKLQGKLSYIIESPSAIQAAIQQFDADIHYLLMSPGLLLTEKKLVKAIIRGFNELNTLFEKRFISIDPQQKITIPNFAHHLTTLSSSINLIPSFHSRAKDVLPALSTLGSHILLVFQHLTGYFKMWCEDNKDR